MSENINITLSMSEKNWKLVIEALDRKAVDYEFFQARYEELGVNSSAKEAEAASVTLYNVSDIIKESIKDVE